MSTCRRRIATVLVLLLWLLSSTGFASSPVATKQVTPADQIQFDQAKAQAHMRELEERMYRLAETIRELEPDDSARLLLALQKSRQELIVEQMKQILALVGKTQLHQATAEQKEVLVKLEELRELLLSTDLDFRLKLERLRKLEKALQALDQAIKEETRLRDQSQQMDEAAQKGPQKLDKRNLDTAQTEQQRNRQATESVQRSVKELGPSVGPAAGALGEAGQKMAGAEGSLGQQQPGQAGQQQDDAVKAMNKARQALERERQRLLEEIRRQLAGEIIARLTDLLERQVKVREATETLAPKVAAGNRQAVLAVRQLAPSEQRLADTVDGTIKLIQETNFSAALPPALESVQRRMIYVANDLSAGQADTAIVARQKQIEQDLKDLIEAMQPAAQSNPGDKAGQCQSCGGDKNKLLAEMKIIRLLQVRVNEETIDADGQRARAEAQLDDATRARIGDVRKHQGAVRDATDKIHHAICRDCLDH